MPPSWWWIGDSWPLPACCFWSMAAAALLTTTSARQKLASRARPQRGARVARREARERARASRLRAAGPASCGASPRKRELLNRSSWGGRRHFTTLGVSSAMPMSCSSLVHARESSPSSISVLARSKHRACRRFARFHGVVLVKMCTLAVLYSSRSVGAVRIGRPERPSCSQARSCTAHVCM